MKEFEEKKDDKEYQIITAIPWNHRVLEAREQQVQRAEKNLPNKKDDLFVEHRRVLFHPIKEKMQKRKQKRKGYNYV